MKHSIRIKITLLLTVSLASTILLCWILNKTFLTSYYQYNKVKALDTTYYELNKMFQDGDITEISEEMIQKIDNLTANHNVNANLFIFTKSRFYPIFVNNERDLSRIKDSMQAYLLGTDAMMQIENISHIKTVKNKYDICKQDDLSRQATYLDLIGFLDSGLVVFLRTNYESLQESSAISNQFLGFIGAFVIIIGTFIMLIISRSFTKPLVTMEGIARKMTDLDFDVKYNVKTMDEYGRLGTSLNLLSEKLEKTISELKSANNELLNDNQRKTQIDEMRKEFLSNVTHELKTPIALIQGYAEGLKDNVNDDASSREFYCEVIIDEAMKMNKMVQKLLSLNQLESGLNTVEFARFDLAALFRSVIASTEILMRQKEITVHFEDTEPCYVWADESMIEEVVTNYISNAINHCSGAKIIEVKLLKSNNIVRAAVFNTGSLIPEEDLAKVWEKFYKVDKARTREYGGTGIGLSIVKAIMNSHNKAYGVANRTNGVEFWFELDCSNK